MCACVCDVVSGGVCTGEHIVPRSSSARVSSPDLRRFVHTCIGRQGGEEEEEETKKTKVRRRVKRRRRSAETPAYDDGEEFWSEMFGKDALLLRLDSTEEATTTFRAV